MCILVSLAGAAASKIVTGVYNDKFKLASGSLSIIA
jgi:hypothetical protein